MMQSAYLWNRDDRTLGCFLSVSALGRVAIQGHVAAGSVVVGDVALQQSPQLRLAERDHVVRALPTDRADHALDVSVLPRRAIGCGHLLDAHVRNAVREGLAVDRIAIPDQVARLGAVAGESLDDLLRRPRGRGMRSDVDVNDLASAMAENDERIKQSKRGGRYDEEVTGGGAAEVIGNEGSPRL